MSQTFVTGGTGFVAQWLVNELLQDGYKVRTTARSEVKAEPMKKHWAKEFESGKFEVAIVPDLAQPGCLDQHLTDVDSLFGIATVSDPKPGDNWKDEMLDPTIALQENTYKSALKNGVKRAVFVGTCLAVCDYEKSVFIDYTYTEADYSKVSYEEAATTPDMFKAYAGAKRLGERSIWDLHKGNEKNMSVTFLHMGGIFGPTCIPSSPLNISNGFIKGIAGGLEMPDTFPTFIDGRSLAKALILALKPQAANQRYLVSDGEVLWHDVVQILNKALGKDLKVPDRPQVYWKFSTAKIEKELGFKPAYTLEQTITDLCKEF